MLKKLFFSLLFLCSFGTLSDAANLVKSSISSQKDISITVYNTNIGLINDTRELDLPKGWSWLMFTDVASSLIPESVSITAPDSTRNLSIYEQQYEYDLLSPEKLLDRYVGKKVKVQYKNQATDRIEEAEATVLSNNNGTIFQIGDEITFDDPERIFFPEIPKDLTATPTLKFLIENKSSGNQKIRASYLTENINWKADYILTMDRNSRTSDITGWVTIDNQSGMTFQNAQLTLIAGEIHRAPSDVRPVAVGMAKAGELATQFEEKSFSEYHIYKLKRKTTAKNNQTKQIHFMRASGVPVSKQFIIKGKTPYYYSQYRQGKTKSPVGVYVNLTNTKKANLGIPLPAGIMRVYSYDDAQTLQFMGEDRIDHTPENGDIKFKIGEAFDITSERTQTDWVRLAEGVFESSFEIRISNQKSIEILVTIIEPVPGDWRVVETSHDFRKTSAHTLEYDLQVPAKKETVLKYRIRVII